MTKSPPLLPEQKLGRVLKIARADSIGIIVCAGFSLLLAAAASAGVFAFFSALALVCGVMEWHGHARLRDGFAGGLQWLTGAQGCLYTVIVGYVLWRLNHFEAAELWAQVPEANRLEFDAKLREAGFDPETDRTAFLQSVNVFICAVLVILSTVYQGGLTLWYTLQRKAIFTALHGAAPQADE